MSITYGNIYNGINVGPHEQKIMAKTIWGEAEGEPWLGKLAVGAVILNRVLSKRWPDNIPSVCLQPAQFSCWNSPGSRLFRIASLDETYPSFQHCVKAVKELIFADPVDNIKGSTHFHALHVKPLWAKDKTPVYKIAGHLFYNDVD